MKSFTPQQLQAQFNRNDCLIIDVREPAEFAEAHIEGSLSIPLSQVANQFSRIQQLAKNKTPIVMCHAGGRSAKAWKILHEKGLDVANLDGGISAWIDANLNVVRGETRRLPIIRQLHIAIGAILLLSSALGLAGISWCFYIPLALGAGLTFAGLTGICPLAMLIAKMPWNRVASNDSCHCE